MLPMSSAACSCQWKQPLILHYNCHESRSLFPLVIKKKKGSKMDRLPYRDPDEVQSNYEHVQWKIAMCQRCAHAQNKNLVPNLRFLIIMTKHSDNRRDLLLPTEYQWNVVPKTSRLKTNTPLKHTIRGKNWMRSTLAAFFFLIIFYLFIFFCSLVSHPIYNLSGFLRNSHFLSRSSSWSVRWARCCGGLGCHLPLLRR